MFGQNDNKESFEGPAFRALGGYPDFGQGYSNPQFPSDDVYKSLPVENSLEPVTWRSGGEGGFGGGLAFEGGGEMGGWGAGMPHEDLSMNPKFDIPQFGGGRKELYRGGWGFQQQQTSHAKTMAALDVVVSDAEPPQAPGGYLEPNYHFLSTTKSTKLFQALQEYLDDQEIDFVVKPAKFKCKCVTYRNGAKLPFNIRIFATNKPRQYAVEFNRRCGDVIHFGEVYRKAKAKLSEGGHVVLDQPSTPVRDTSFELPPLDLEPNPDAAVQTLDCLVEMATSPFVDVQGQALQAITDMTANRASCPAFPGKAVDLLVDSLSSNSEDIHRCAITCLANLVVGQLELCQRLAQQRVISTLLAFTASDCSQVARESARALANMGEIMNALMADFEPRLRTEVPVLEKSADAKVRRYAAALQQRIVV